MTPLFQRKNAFSSRLLCLPTVSSAFYHCTKKPTKCFKGGASLPYRIALCLNAAIVLESMLVNQLLNQFYQFKFNLFVHGAGRRLLLRDESRRLGLMTATNRIIIDV